ncbi:hypothetical protein U0070_014707, partial [Myodes glareolus]
MASENVSSVKEFILLGLTQKPELQIPLFFLFLGIYVVSMVGNLGMIVLIVLNPHLHTPMYYFLFNLSFTDLCYSSVVTPKMLVSFVKQNIISHAECMTQLFFFAFFVIDECYILTAMAYDRYAAICKPLLYQVTMSYHVCHLMTIGVYVMGFVGAMAHIVCMLRLTFCGGNIINHYMCDIPPLLKLSCTSTYMNELVVFIVVGVNVTVPSLTIFISYTLILSNILAIRSAEGRSKAFSTCGSHVIAVSFFFGAIIFMYLKPSSVSGDEDKVCTIFYTIVGPMLNPFIYSIRNKDVHIALRKTLKKTMTRGMAAENNSSVKELILLGLTQQPELQIPLFFLFLGIYVVSIVGNLGLIVLYVLNPHLHTPMYYFLFNLSFTDLCYSSVIIPKMLVSFVKQNIISHAECMTQLFFFAFFVIDECYILTAMAYDRYAAICKPLLYQVTMSNQVCHLMMVGVNVMGFVGAMAHIVCMLNLTFCDDIINHYMCDLPPLLKLSCTSTYINELVIFIVVGVNVTVPSLTIFISYTLILSNILGIRSAEGRSKAFSTCGSHVVAVSFFFGALAFMYLKPSSVSGDEDKVSTIFYTIVGPMLNPFIYSIRNKDVHIALRKTLKK